VDWDRIVRHGIKPDGKPAVMPAIDFVRMSDQELSDIIAYISAQPPVDRVVPPVKTGPLAKMLVATGQIRLSAAEIEAHDAAHPRYPPKAEVTATFGGHIAGTCTGCHRADFSGGPIIGGDPSWVPAANLTPHAEGLREWTYDDFRTALRDGRRPDGSALRAPMDGVMPFARRMTEVELEALWVYFQSLPPLADGK
jgi:mono/diheme cytochrome c family protein